jgi:hypothetical protein
MTHDGTSAPSGLCAQGRLPAAYAADYGLSPLSGLEKAGYCLSPFSGVEKIERRSPGGMALSA